MITNPISLVDISIDVSYGYTASAEHSPVGPKFLRITDIREGSIDWESVPYCTIDEKNLVKNKLEVGDIVVARTGATTGINQIIKEDTFAVFASYLIRFRINKKLADPFFIGHYLKSKFWIDHVASIIGGSAQPGANAKQFGEFVINLPPLPTQKAIAEILSSLDDKIELNNQINQNLEALAQALFKQWFVDFEFPNESGETYKSSGGEMIDSELGEIPKGWEVKSLDEIAEYLNGIALQKFRPINETDPFLPVIKIRELRQGYADGEEKASIEIDKKYIILDGDILFSWSGSLLVDFWTGGKGALNQHLFKVTSQTYPKWFIFLWTKFHLLEFQKIAESKATTMGHIQRKHLSDAKVLVPSNSLLKKFTETFDCIIEELISSRLESRKLMNLRDTLLPKLISGELEVNESLLEPTF
jgi:type I restriction enzyme S subunit